MIIMCEFCEREPIKELDKLLEHLEGFAKDKRRLFRGYAQRDCTQGEKAFKSSFEEHCGKSGERDVDTQRKIEKMLIREFRRRYDGNDRHDVESDTLYCMSLMRHHGAPTRLLDWTYSPYVAVHFALEHWWRDYEHNSESNPEVCIWCLDDTWCTEASKKMMPHRIAKNNLDKFFEEPEAIQRKADFRRIREDQFTRLFMDNKYEFVCAVNPYHLHPRLGIQQGVFLCPGKVGMPILDTMKKMAERTKDSCKDQPIVKVRWQLGNRQKDCMDAFDKLYQMNISQTSLFPGLDGFAASLKYRFRFFGKLPTKN